MDFLLSCFTCLNQQIFALPATFLFLGVGIFLTVWTGFAQITGFPRFMRLITKGIPLEEHLKGVVKTNTMSPIRALLTAMGTTIGMGNMVGPTVAIMVGGPSALFWLVVYIFFGSVIKFTEVIFAIRTRVKTVDGHIVGGPMYYLQSVHPILAHWYAGVMIFLFAGWSSIQSNTLATIFEREGITPWITGLLLASIVLIVLQGGVKRVGAVAAKLVPFMFILYLSFAFFILGKNLSGVWSALQLVFSTVFRPSAMLGGFTGVTLLQAMRAGIYRGIYITEAGLGSSSIAHAVTNVKHAKDQGLLALFSSAIDALLCTISGLLVLVTGVWLRGSFRSTLIYEVFKLHAPGWGTVSLLLTLFLFVLTTVIGNSFNGIQTFSSITNYRWTYYYLCFTALLIFGGALMQVRLAWEIMDTLLTLVAIPNLIGIVILACRHRTAVRV